MTTTRDGTRAFHRDLLDLADYAYDRLATRLDGLTDEEYLWEPAPGCWSVRRAADGTWLADRPRRPGGAAGAGGSDGAGPPLTTIAWRLCHLIDLLADERNATWIGVAPRGSWDRVEPGRAAAAVDALERAYRRFREHVAAADPAGLDEPMGEGAGPYADSSRAAFVLHELDELIHHGAEVACLRDVYRATGAGVAGAGGPARR